MRVVWLVGVCGRSLPAVFWGDAFALLTHHILAYDIVVGLTAIFGLSNLATMVMEENAVSKVLLSLQEIHGNGFETTLLCR